jgi:hypothetical protein
LVVFLTHRSYDAKAMEKTTVEHEEIQEWVEKFSGMPQLIDHKSAKAFVFIFPVSKDSLANQVRLLILVGKNSFVSLKNKSSGFRTAICQHYIIQVLHIGLCGEKQSRSKWYAIRSLVFARFLQ